MTELDFPYFGKHLVECLDDLGVVPVEFANKAEDFIYSLLGEDVVYQVTNE